MAQQTSDATGLGGFEDGENITVEIYDAAGLVDETKSIFLCTKRNQPHLEYLSIFNPLTIRSASRARSPVRA